MCNLGQPQRSIVHFSLIFTVSYLYITVYVVFIMFYIICELDTKLTDYN
jgi:hypothetical protein